jgi:hypothetical protein
MSRAGGTTAAGLTKKNQTRVAPSLAVGDTPDGQGHGAPKSRMSAAAEFLRRPIPSRSTIRSEPNQLPNVPTATKGAAVADNASSIRSIPNSRHNGNGLLPNSRHSANSEINRGSIASQAVTEAMKVVRRDHEVMFSAWTLQFYSDSPQHLQQLNEEYHSFRRSTFNVPILLCTAVLSMLFIGTRGCLYLGVAGDDPILHVAFVLWMVTMLNANVVIFVRMAMRANDVPLLSFLKVRRHRLDYRRPTTIMLHFVSTTL